MIASLVMFIRTYLTSERVQKIKFRIVTIGLALGIIPVSTVMVIKQIQPTFGIAHGHVSVIFLSFISISFAYAILKHDAFDLGIVIRKGLSFVILSALLISVYYVFVNVLGERFGSISSIRPSFLSVIAIVLLALIFVPARAGIQKLIDRAFRGSRKIFRGQVIEFTRSIQHLLSIDDIAGFVARQLRELFKAECIHIFMKEAGSTYKLRLSHPSDASMPLTSFPPNTALIQLLQQKNVPLMIEYLDRLWIRNNLDRISIELLSLSQAAAVVPLIEQREFLGFILVGRKMSGRPYTGADAEVFELLGERSALALRNIELYRDSIRKEKLEEELQLASEIQKRLLPERPPHLEHATLIGGIRTSREVGGDFYDYVELSPGKVGIAVADVSGKGIPASMLMTTLQASFRAEALKERPPSEVLGALNRSLYERSDSTKFATFFYAVFDDPSGILQYSNGGSFPPIVFQRDGGITRLQRGGILVGIEEDSVYREGVVKLREDDLVVMYTDGFIDQENESGEPFGEHNLIEFFRNNLSISLDDMLEKLFATIIAFGQNNVKDDMTIVLLRKK
jgi:sigma-B regulation protein RsbU (phosphoserine phosphatase)